LNWISVSNYLPFDGQRVDIWAKPYVNEDRYTDSFWCEKTQCFSGSSDRNNWNIGLDKVSHWMVIHPPNIKEQS